MKIIPKEEIERENALRLDLLAKKQSYARLVFEQQKIDSTFVGELEQINAMPSGSAKTQLLAGYAACETAAAKIQDAAWLTDVKGIVKQLKKDEENKEAK